MIFGIDPWIISGKKKRSPVAIAPATLGILIGKGSRKKNYILGGLATKAFNPPPTLGIVAIGTFSLH